MFVLTTITAFFEAATTQLFFVLVIVDACTAIVLASLHGDFRPRLVFQFLGTNLLMYGGGALVAALVLAGLPDSALLPLLAPYTAAGGVWTVGLSVVDNLKRIDAWRKEQQIGATLPPAPPAEER